MKAIKCVQALWGVVVLGVLIGPAWAAPGAAHLMTADAPARAARAADVPGCPDQGGILDSITVSVDQALNLRVVVGAPAPEGGAAFNVFSDNAAIVAAGDRRQGFIPRVTIPEGATQSNAFTIFGVSVGQTRLQLQSLSPNYLSGNFPLGAWDVNKSGSGSDQKFLDANDPAKSCRVPDTAMLSTSAQTQAACGKSIKGVAADGVNALLLRTVSGLAGTACFEIVSASPVQQGSVQTPLTGTSAVSGLNYGFSYYTPPAFFGDSADSRDVEIEFTFTPNIGNGNTSRQRATLKVVRPPLVLVHGLWSGPDSWNEDFLRNDAVRTSVAADYSATNASAFSTNIATVQDAAADALTTMRRKLYAATQVDVAGHSMGGLLTRLYADAPAYKRPDNLDQGDVHRLVTLDTPHFGSSFANLLVSLHNVDAATATKLESTVTGLTGGSVLQGAVCDLAENSVGLSALAGGTSLRSQAITATGGPAGTPASPAEYWGGATVFGAKSFESALTSTYCADWAVWPVSCNRREFYFPQNIVDAFRFQEANDAVVALSSQRGGLAGINFNAYLHFHIPAIPGVTRGITDGADVATRLAQLLEGPDTGFAVSLPGVPADGSGSALTVGTATAAADYATQCGAGGPMGARATKRRVGRGGFGRGAPDPRVTIVSPTAGSLVTLGDALSVEVELSPLLGQDGTVGVTFVGLQHVEAEPIGGRSFRAILPSTVLASGPLTLVPEVTDTTGKVVFGAPVVVGVRSASPPVAIALQRRNFFERPGATPRQLYLSGTLADGSVVDMSSALSGTTYGVSDPAVLSVSADGRVSPLGVGRAQVTVRQGGLTEVASFTVEDPAAPLPPTSLTSELQITRSGIRLDRTTGFYVQDLRLTNIGAGPLSGPLYLIVKDLTAGVTLVSKSGLTEQVTPLQSPYLIVPLPAEGLSLPAGSQVSYVLQFLNPGRLSIGYTADVVTSSTEP